MPNSLLNNLVIAARADSVYGGFKDVHINGLHFGVDASATVVNDAGAIGGKALVFPAGTPVLLATPLNSLLGSWGTGAFSYWYRIKWNETITTAFDPLRIAVGMVALDGFETSPSADVGSSSFGVTWRMPFADGSFWPNVPQSGALSLQAWHTILGAWDPITQTMSQWIDGANFVSVPVGKAAGTPDVLGMFTLDYTGVLGSGGGGGDFRIDQLNVARAIPNAAGMAAIFANTPYSGYDNGTGGGGGGGVVDGEVTFDGSGDITIGMRAFGQMQATFDGVGEVAIGMRNAGAGPIVGVINFDGVGDVAIGMRSLGRFVMSMDGAGDMTANLRDNAAVPDRPEFKLPVHSVLRYKA